MTKPRLAAILIAALQLPALAWAANYRIVDHIKVPDGGFDYATFDSATARVFMPRGAFTTVIDTKSGAVSQMGSAVGDHIALPVPGTTLLVVTQRAGSILLVDAANDTAVARFTGEKNPNSAAYDPATKQVVVLNKDSGTATIVDPFARKLAAASVPVSKNTLEFPAADGAGLVFDNIETTGEIVAFDVGSRRVVKTFKLKGCEGPSGLAYDAKDKLLISVCGNGLLKVVRAKDGAEIASLTVGHGPDAVIYDPVRRMAFVPCGQEGVLDVVSLANPKKIAVVQRVATMPGSRTGTVDPITGKVYLMSSKTDPNGPPTANGRQPRLAGSWEVLVVGPS